MGKTKGRVQQERRLADMCMAPSSLADARWSPDPESIVEEYRINMPLQGLGRLVGRQALDESNRLIEFALTAQINVGSGMWSDVVRVDTAHEEVHIHYFSRSGDQIGREVLLEIRSINDVHDGYDRANKLIIVNWDDHERRWRSGR